MIPQFGFHKVEQLACALMGASGVLSMLFVLTPNSANGGHGRSYFLVLQSVAVIAGAIGAWRSFSFTLAAIGVASSLMVWTPVGRICFLPGLLMLVLIVPRFRTFSIFLPRWRGPGPPPPM